MTLAFRQHGNSVRTAVAALLATAWLLIWTTASAQSFPPLSGVVADGTGQLNAQQINDAARSLSDLGVKPLAVFMSGMSNASSIDDFAQKAAANYGFGDSSGAIDPNLFAIVVTTNPRQLTVKWGDNLNSIMADAPDGKGVGTKIRTQDMQPALAAGNYTDAFVNSFNQAAAEISIVRIRQVPHRHPHLCRLWSTILTRARLGTRYFGLRRWLWLVLFCLLRARIIYRAWRKRQESAVRIASLQTQLAQARTVAADMITNLDYPADPREQIQYRFLALALEKERPDQLGTITTQYKQMYARVADALTRYNALNDAKPVAEADLSSAIAGYQAVQAEVNDAAAFLKHLADVSKEVEGQVQAAPGELDQAKKALAAATSSLERLSAAAPDLYKPSAEKTLSGPTSSVADAEQALHAPVSMPLKAYDAAAASAKSPGDIASGIESVGQAYTALTALRGKVGALQNQGYKLASSGDDLSGALKLLSDGARALEAGTLEDAGAKVKQAGDSISAESNAIDASVAMHNADRGRSRSCRRLASRSRATLSRVLRFLTRLMSMRKAPGAT